LSEFCTKLTGIRQADVDDAPYFREAFPQFMEWISDTRFTLCSWGGYDLNQFRRDCLRNTLPLPETLEQHINLKKQFSALYNVRPTGMMGALARLGIPAEGQHHRGIDDARNIAKIAVQILPTLRRMRRV
jgi:3'-5' exoribonuclease 1